MRSTRILRFSAVSALVLAFGGAGCGGCESCFGKASPEDDAALPTSTARPAPTVADAAPEAESTTKEPKEAGLDAAPDASEPYLRTASLPRPKAPMPTGAFQSCGRYDGPLCEKKCPNGNCRQECDGVECLLTCEKGYCSQMCGASATCKMTCQGGHCVQSCTKPEGCIKECTGGSCE
jgi:hypothetical protein